MANVLVEEGSLRAIANAIRERSGSTDAYTPSQMAGAILALSIGIQSAELTLSEYAALTQEEKHNGTVYYVKDAIDNGGIIYLNGVAYGVTDIAIQQELASLRSMNETAQQELASLRSQVAALQAAVDALSSGQGPSANIEDNVLVLPNATVENDILVINPGTGSVAGDILEFIASSSTVTATANVEDDILVVLNGTIENDILVIGSGAATISENTLEFVGSTGSAMASVDDGYLTLTGATVDENDFIVVDSGTGDVTDNVLAFSGGSGSSTATIDSNDRLSIAGASVDGSDYLVVNSGSSAVAENILTI